MDLDGASSPWPARARRLWRLFEAYHAVVYFAPEVRAACDGVGLRGGWMAYFAGRAAPLGPVPAEVVVATFYNFHPGMVARAIPDAWSFAAPDTILAARTAAVGRALERVGGAEVASDAVQSAAALAREALGGCGLGGRPLFAAHTALGWPAAPHLALWHACTLLREHRGDGHVAALTTAGIDGCQAHVTLAATGAVPAETLRANRGWSEDEWADAAAALRARGLLDERDALTDAGPSLRTWIEDRTDELAAVPWQRLGDERTAAFERAIAAAAAPILAAQLIPFPNPMGLSPRDEVA
ncbi:MAG TPA: hypothetical protein VGV67_10175 [Solirubrobacteraceae bacterium]|nr:hypothetical protein [Solirubrobacteraceae bacterium]